MGKSRDNFVRLAESRTNKILKDLDLLANLSNRSNYAYEEADLKKIFSALNSKLRDTHAKFDLSLKKKKSDDFKL